MRRVGALAIGLGALSTSVTFLPATAQQPTVQRKVLPTRDSVIPGYQTVTAGVEIPSGGRDLVP